ncbi:MULTISPECIES: thiamine-phosphate kinase [Desulfococcus]|jgi:thiamine-monophosphate kinase|uniref:Thiamine-monophosphate kinase n=1 Tax=Desulfococcus multivorans DSM 2059 TaxID=1121405 RepID=S7UZN2_DESML|nr:thiamine-phosphate kinase [Desulfococcus multivorans]AOY60626.1 ThiL: thiamine-monophosphate kinase [Desulfococcus multivorans]AQV02716.1 thiamine-phosphate kinase [Desulfococcus multivorans]EPR39664.1 thiamine-monophosphate kinase [Desulfococcus multivorans DSM 2059]MDX9819440.1 thiamine-phosphate kinase [Desulfococcus multivorans]SKA03530.1 thiamine-monophosphate kinase [Desulfococcus multivorans DSM 2059]
MEFKDIGEFGFIRRIQRGCLIRPEGVRLPIGDDAAAFIVPDGQVALVTTDLLVEGVHFLRNGTSPEDLGHKALAVNLSDIAAMGGTAREAFVSIAVPGDCALAYVEGIYRGMISLAGEFGVNILGGDTTGSRSDLIINVAVVGAVHEREMLRRGGARPGDCLFVTGAVGDSRAGLHLLRNRLPADSDAFMELLSAHHRPRPHLAEGRFLGKSGAVRAAIDISDGLSSDLVHVARASGLGVRIDAGRLPISENLKTFCRRFGFDAVDYALSGGEDYVLACTVDPTKAAAVAQAFMARFHHPLYHIGKMTSDGRMTVVQGGEVRPFPPAGWRHFSETEEL